MKKGSFLLVFSSVNKSELLIQSFLAIGNSNLRWIAQQMCFLVFYTEEWYDSSYPQHISQCLAMPLMNGISYNSKLSMEKPFVDLQLLFD